jgi:ribose 5-phosphate isomerase A
LTADDEKREAGVYAAGLVEDGMRVGLGTGTTVAPFVEALAARRLSIRCVATSPATETLGRGLGLVVESFEDLSELDIAVDGADQIAPGPWLVKGGGRAHTREKLVAAASARFVVIASSDKPVARIGPPVPVELLAFGLTSSLRRLEHVAVREGPLSPDGGVIADWTGPVEDPAALAALLDHDPGVVGHGLFGPELVTDVVVARDGSVSHDRAH